jgi:ATP-dependent DNA helicase PIF1
MRNIDRKEGPVKNLRVKIVFLGPQAIRVCTLNPVGRRYYNIPRIRFSIKLPYGRSVKMERRQFPLRLAYSITFNKSQGQEFQLVLADIRNNPFTHGHLYVALSRIRIAKNIRLFTNRPSDNEKESDEDKLAAVPIVTNVVYEKLRL